MVGDNGQTWVAYLAGPQFAPVRQFVITLAAATALYLFSLAKGFTGSTARLKALFPGRSDVFYDRVDFFVVIVFGSVIGTVFFDPKTSPQALAAGFSWIGAVNVLSARTAAQVSHDEERARG